MEESWLLMSARIKKNTSPSSSDSINTGGRDNQRNTKRQRIANDESSPVSESSSDEKEPETESKILACAAKAVTQDVPDDNEEQEAKLPALVHIPMRADGQIVCHADNESLSDHEGEDDAISFEDMDSVSSFVKEQQEKQKKLAIESGEPKQLVDDAGNGRGSSPIPKTTTRF